MAQEIDFANRLYFDYQNYREASLTDRRFKHSDIEPLINRLKDKNIFEVKKAGESAQGRSIYLLKLGTGATKIFLWSQMHGDESTATMALFDMFNFFSANDSYNDIRHDILSKVTLYFMPMVNPDGAEVFQRRNDFGIDINRDAARLQSPESKVLMDTYDSLKADFGFNLHDQSIYYSAGHSFKSATLSFLAPAFNYEKDLNPVRERAVKLIGRMFKVMSGFIPGHIARYPDDFEPRAFGDNFQKGGTSTILIESGGWKDDPEKQFIRKLNFLAMLSAIKSIADTGYKNEPDATYESIPFNERDMMDLIIRNVTYKKDGYTYKIDIGINRIEESYNNARNFYYKSVIEDIGDLSTYFGYEDYDFNGLEVEIGKTYSGEFKSLKDVESADLLNVYEQGCTGVAFKSDDLKNKFTHLPLNIMSNGRLNQSSGVKPGGLANLVFIKSGEVRYVLINGFLYDVKNLIGEVKNALILD